VMKMSLKLTEAVLPTLCLSWLTTRGSVSARKAAPWFTGTPVLTVMQNLVTAGASGFTGIDGVAGFARLTTSATMAPTTPKSTKSARPVRSSRREPPAAAALGGASPLSGSPSGAQHGAMWASSAWPIGDTAASRSMSAGAPGVLGGGAAGVCGENSRGAAGDVDAPTGLSGKGPADMLAPLRA
jgi:hypothetical protein